MKIFKKLSLATCVSMALSLPVTAAPWTHYDQNPDFQAVTMPSGAVMNISAAAETIQNTRIGGELRAEKIIDGVHAIHGIFYGPIVIERPNGLIVFNSGEHVEDGENFRRIIREQISDKPILAVLYDHSHYSKGTTTLLDGDDAQIIAHPLTNEIMASAEGIAMPNILEMGPLLNARSDIHFGNLVPKEGPDATASAIDLDFSIPTGFVKSNYEMTDGEEIEIDGLKIQAFHVITDAEDAMIYWMPELEMVVDNVFWPSYNMYTLRGDRYRDPQDWMKALRIVRDLNPEMVISAGGASRVFVGKDKITRKANALHDGMAFIYDQSIRLSNRGIKPAELKHHIDMPEELQAYSVVNEAYGQFDSFPEAIPLENQGWFSGYAEDMHSLPFTEKAKRTVRMMGGEERVLAEYQRAYDAKEFLWAKDLAFKLYNIDPASVTYRQGLANTFRELGQRSPGSIVRNFYLSSARSLEGDENVTLTAVESEQWIKADVKRAVNHLRIRVQPEQAKGLDHMIQFEIDGETVGLHVRNSIAEFVENPAEHYKAADATIKLSAAEFVDYYQGKSPVKGLEMFEMFKQIPMYPTEHQQG